MKKNSRRMKAYTSVLLLVFFVLSVGVFEVQAMDGRSREAKHIILMVGDGMNIEHEIATSRYLYGKDYDLSFHKFPYQANVATWDVTTYKHWSGGVYDPNAINPILGYDPAKGGKVPYPIGPELRDPRHTTWQKPPILHLLLLHGQQVTRRMMETLHGCRATRMVVP